MKPISPIILLISLSLVTCKKDELSRQMKVETIAPTQVMATSAIVQGNIIDLGEGSEQYGHCWGMDSEPTVSGNKTQKGVAAKIGVYSSELDGLLPGKTYHVRAYMQRGSELVYGKEESFTTLDGKVILTTSEITNITINSATSGGNISIANGDQVLSRGVCWDTLATITLKTKSGYTINGSGTGSFTSELTGLIHDKTYYVKAYAITSVDTSYGIAHSFATLNGAGTLTTTAVTYITATSVTCGGNIINDGGSPIIVRGVCWSTSPNPTITDNKTIDGSGSGIFSTGITGLSVGTTYYFRAYATNSLGTVYGQEISDRIGIIIDTDGNEYTTVTFGTQTWMAENLKTTKYNDGTSIPNVTSNSTWANLSSPSYCWYNIDVANNKNKYGALYNWYVVNTGKLCPLNWHVPTDAEWTILTDYVGGEDVAGGKLKEMGTAHWASPNTVATNETGFSALPGGYRYYHDGSFFYAGKYGYWWSASGNGSSDAWYRNMSYNSSAVNRYYYYKGYGFSVRCLRDK